MRKDNVNDDTQASLLCAADGSRTDGHETCGGSCGAIRICNVRRNDRSVVTCVFACPPERIVQTVEARGSAPLSEGVSGNAARYLGRAVFDHRALQYALPALLYGRSGGTGLTVAGEHAAHT